MNQLLYTILFFSSIIGLNGQTPSLADYRWLPVEAIGDVVGHTSGTTNMFDSYDLKTGKWKDLIDAPHIRDHFPAIVAKDKMYCIGGRNTSVHYPNDFGALLG
jgi:hypothetical protein